LFSKEKVQAICFKFDFHHKSSTVSGDLLILVYCIPELKVIFKVL